MAVGVEVTAAAVVAIGVGVVGAAVAVVTLEFVRVGGADK